MQTTIRVSGVSFCMWVCGRRNVARLCARIACRIHYEQKLIYLCYYLYSLFSYYMTIRYLIENLIELLLSIITSLTSSVSMQSDDPRFYLFLVVSQSECNALGFSFAFWLYPSS